MDVVERTIFVVLAFGDGAPRAVAEGGDPVWSPDGERIVATAPTRGLTVLTLATGETVPITDWLDTPLGWCPNGEWILFRRYLDDENTGVYVVTPTGRGCHRLASGSRLSGAWSPDGKELFIYRSARTWDWRTPTLAPRKAEELWFHNDRTDEGTVPIRRSQRRFWAARETSVVGWSDRGVVVSRSKKGTHWLYAVEDDGRTWKRRLPPNAAGGFPEPRLSPDGRHVVYLGR